MQISDIETDSEITADLVESQKLMVPELGRDGGLWNTLELAQGGLQEPAFVLFFRSTANGCKATSQPEMKT